MKILLGLTLTCALAAQSHASETVYSFPQQDEQCLAQPTLAVCRQIACESVAGCSTPSAKEVIDLDARVRWRFNYRFTAETISQNLWRVNYSSDKVWFGDCNGLAGSVLETLAQAGTPTRDLYRAIVYAESEAADLPGSSANHQVTLVRDSAGAVWVVGDVNDRKAYRVEGLTAKIIYLARADKGNRWTKVSSNKEALGLIGDGQ